MAVRSLGRLARACADTTAASFLFQRARATFRPATATPLRAKSSNATTQLLQCVDRELALESKTLVELPPLAGFDVSVAGSVATLQRAHEGGDSVKVVVDANNALEVTEDDWGGEEEEESEEEEEPFFVPTFSVSIANPQGDSLQFECSFDDTTESYTDQGAVWDSMRIDSVSVLPRGTESAETVFSADGQNLSQELYSCLMEYLKERGIDEKFAADILTFYRTFEHRCYTLGFLKCLKEQLAS